MRLIMRFLRPIPLVVLSLLYGCSVAVYGWIETDLNLSLSCEGQPLRGENILHGLGLAFFAGLGGVIVLAILLWIFWMRSSWLRFSIAALCVLGAAAFGAAIAFVALDSATYIQQNSTCGFSTLFSSGRGAESGHFGELYVLWGVAIAALLVGAVRVVAEHPPVSPRQRPLVGGPDAPKSKYEQPGRQSRRT